MFLLKIKALLWKELEYRLKCTTFLTFIVLFIAGIVANLGLYVLSYCPSGSLSFSSRSSQQIECASEPFDNFGSRILAYEPSSPFLQKLVTKVACLAGFNETSRETREK